MKFFKELQEDLGLSEECLCILNCFLDPENMIKMKEVPNPLNPNTEVLEYTKDGKIIPKQPPSNIPKSDPIWELFNPTNDSEGMDIISMLRSCSDYSITLDPSDVDLRHALANMTAVVFGLPNCSNHLWYHMFSPGDLENSCLTGFMVRHT